ncbi:hypothetical protein SEA_ALEEMILY_156 [Gordonia phage Aleemily]|uniref:Uncharacterized protein n=1 Tax=Gordonia phage Aleemily TaxID=2965181 RepID=A0A9E7QDQ7_9CAUD|nr:hypothetical protein SEA_ALEEMILY_156 [Gordonia phage Aleemily]
MSLAWSAHPHTEVEVRRGPDAAELTPDGAVYGDYVLTVTHEGNDGIAIEGSLADFDALIETIQAKLAATRAEIADRVRAKLAAAREEEP